jgi:hypothetical protein
VKKKGSFEERVGKPIFFDSYITTHKLVGVQWQPMELGL